MVYKRYEWKDAKLSKGLPAQVVGETFEQIERRDGVLTKEAFLEASRPENSPTHKCFEWDDSVAAEKYRLTQSRMIINSIAVTITKANGEEQKAPAFVNVEIKTDSGKYKNIEVAMNNESEKAIVLQNALNELKQFEKKYGYLKELERIFEEIHIAEIELKYF